MHVAIDSIEVQKAEARFRQMAFSIAYNHIFGTVANLTARFVYAIAYSARPIKDKSLFRAWWQWTRGKSIKKLLSEGSQPPPELRPMVESYLEAVKKREAETGDEPNSLL